MYNGIRAPSYARKAAVPPATLSFRPNIFVLSHHLLTTDICTSSYPRLPQCCGDHHDKVWNESLCRQWLLFNLEGLKGRKNNKRIMPNADLSSDIQDGGAEPSNTTTTNSKKRKRRWQQKKAQGKMIWWWEDSQTTKRENAQKNPM